MAAQRSPMTQMVGNLMAQIAQLQQAIALIPTAAKPTQGHIHSQSPHMEKLKEVAAARAVPSVLVSGGTSPCGEDEPVAVSITISSGELAAAVPNVEPASSTVVAESVVEPATSPTAVSILVCEPPAATGGSSISEDHTPGNNG